MEKTKAIAYYRVSTTKQGISGLGLEAQKEAVTRLFGKEYEIIAEHTEVESGKSSNRPKLAEALAQCKKQKAVLLIAKLDRLSRNVKFIATLQESKARFIAADNPNATEFLINIMAAFAQEEGKQISDRTKAALKAAKARGVKLGTPEQYRYRQAELMRSRGYQRAKELEPQILALKDKGLVTIVQLANALGMKKTVMHRIITRLKQQTN